MAKKIRIWQRIRKELSLLKAGLERQDFWIDVSYRIFRNLHNEVINRNLNFNVIGAYWGKKILDEWLFSNFPLNAKSVFIEDVYYSYLNLKEIAEGAYRGGFQPVIIDLVANTTDLKEGEDLDDWFLVNDEFEESMMDLWDNIISQMWIEEGKLGEMKGDIRNYWNYEDYIRVKVIYDFNLNPMVIFLMGTYDQY